MEESISNSKPGSSNKKNVLTNTPLIIKFINSLEFASNNINSPIQYYKANNIFNLAESNNEKQQSTFNRIIKILEYHASKKSEKIKEFILTQQNNTITKNINRYVSILKKELSNIIRDLKNYNIKRLNSINNTSNELSPSDTKFINNIKSIISIDDETYIKQFIIWYIKTFYIKNNNTGILTANNINALPTSNKAKILSNIKPNSKKQTKLIKSFIKHLKTQKRNNTIKTQNRNISNAIQNNLIKLGDSRIVSSNV